jgi:hypothetical protein
MANNVLTLPRVSMRNSEATLQASKKLLRALLVEVLHRHCREAASKMGYMLVS